VRFDAGLIALDAGLKARTTTRMARVVPNRAPAVRSCLSTFGLRTVEIPDL